MTAVRQHDASDPYDVVFMDWRMPGMDGLQASRHIKSDETLRQPPAIVLVTAFGREEVREEAERLHLEGFLLKPVTRSTIVDTLVNLFAATDAGTHQTADADADRLRGARILLAEDNEINQQIAVELLEGAGAAVTVAGNGREAVDLLSNGPQSPPFDVVLMDLQMPEMDGYQATTKLRADARFASLPIIAMTAHATVEERQRCLAAGMDDHIAKPIDPVALVETVRRYVRRREGAGADGDALPPIDGLNVRDGLARVGGNRTLYHKLLRQFFAEEERVVDDIAAAMAAGDFSLAERLAHTLKGVAGNIGADPVRSAAGELEQLIRARADDTSIVQAAVRVRSRLMPLVTDLKAALGAAREPAVIWPTPPASADPVQVRETAARLSTLLVESDPGAGDFVEAHQAELRPMFSPETWEEFVSRVHGYAFADAQAQLDRAVASFQSTR